MGYQNFRKLPDIKTLYEKTALATNNFSKMKPETLETNPEMLTIIRLGMGLSQRKFARILGITRASLAHYELGNKNMKAQRKMCVADKLNGMLQETEFSKATVASNFMHLWDLAQKGQDAKTMREHGRVGTTRMKPTVQESEIVALLENAKIIFRKASLMDFEGMKFSFDFIIPNSERPEIVIECKTIHSKSKRNMRIISYKIGYEIAYKFRLVQSRSSNIKRIFILNTNYENLPERVILILKKETDAFLINPNKKEILKQIKSV